MAGVTPLKKGAGAVRPAAPAPRMERPEPPQESVPAVPVPASLGPAIVHPFDREVGRALSKGKRAPEASLDLHGMTLVAAEKAVSRFLWPRSSRAKPAAGPHRHRQGHPPRRPPLVPAAASSIDFPGWLERADNRSVVAGVRAAHPRRSGQAGAFLHSFCAGVLRRAAVPSRDTPASSRSGAAGTEIQAVAGNDAGRTVGGAGAAQQLARRT